MKINDDGTITTEEGDISEVCVNLFTGRPVGEDNHVTTTEVRETWEQMNKTYPPNLGEQEENGVNLTDGQLATLASLGLSGEPVDRPLTISSAAEECLRTDLSVEGYNEFKLHCRISSNARLLHGILGLTTEIGELTDVFKRHFFYDKSIDWINVQEKLGDIFWYLVVLLDETSKQTSEPLTEPVSMVINKLKQRYPEKFLAIDALNRNLDKEREALETREEIVEKNERELTKLADEDAMPEVNEEEI